MCRRSLPPSLGALLILIGAPSVRGANIINNGDFELGNTNFTSAYTFSPATNTAAGQYTVRTNPFPWNGFFVTAGDHTSGMGNMFVGNGDPTPGSILWELVSVAVLPNTIYYFEAWAMNVCCSPGYTGPNSPAILEFVVVGSAVESLGIIPTAFPAGQWQFLGTTWNSGTNTSVTMRIINQNTAIGGNDFALDDIYFSNFSTNSSVPEPMTIALMGSGIVLLFLTRRKRSKP